MGIQGGASGANLSLSEKLAVDRTCLAHERTLMAWVRTAVSLISFGFTVFKFFQYLREKNESQAVSPLIQPRQFALMMICIGLVMLLLSTLQHWQYMKTLRKEYSDAFTTPPYSLATVMAGLVSILGIVTLMDIVLR